MRIRAMRSNAVIPDAGKLTARTDASIGLNKFGLFQLTLGDITSGSPRDGSLQLTRLGRKLAIKEEEKRRHAGFQVGICGLATTDFRTSFNELKQQLQDAGFPMATIQFVFSHAIIGLPKSEELLLPLQHRLMDTLTEAGFGFEYGGAFDTGTYRFIAFKSGEETWEVCRAFSNELQQETYKKPQLRKRFKSELGQFLKQPKNEADKVSELREPEEEVPPSPTKESDVRAKRCREEDGMLLGTNATKSARLQHEHDRGMMRSTDWHELLERMASNQDH